MSNIYHVPLILEKQGLHTIIRNHLKLDHIMLEAPLFDSWREMAQIVDSFQQKITICIVGKYVGLQDSYLSVSKALLHSSILLKTKVEITWVESSDLEDATKLSEPEKFEAAWKLVKEANGILVPGGFGVRGTLGKVAAAKYAREKKVPFLGVCLGMQIMVIEYARHVLHSPNANSTEFEEGTADPVIVFMPEINQLELGGTMRLGSRPTSINARISDSHGKPQNSLASVIYGFNDSTEVTSQSLDSSTECLVNERHRHRYEVNPERVEALEAAGLLFTGRDDQGVRMEIAELPRDVHPYYLGAQFHPELKSRPGRPSPPFFGFVAVAAGRGDLLHLAGKLWQEKEAQLHTLKEQSFSPVAGKRKRTSSADVTPIAPSKLQTAPNSNSKTLEDFRLPDSSVLENVASPRKRKGSH